MRYKNTTREPCIDDIVTVPHAIGEWIVEEIKGEDLGLRGQPWAFLWDRSENATFLRVASGEDKKRHMLLMEKMKKGLK